MQTSDELRLLALVAGGMHIPLALTVWSMLHRRWPQRPLLLWVLGSLALGTGATLFALQDQVPGWVGEELANGLLSLAPAMRIAALRIDLGWKLHTRTLLLLCLVDFGGYLLGQQWLSERGGTLLGFACMALWAAGFAWHAAQAGRRLQSRSGLILAAVEALFAAAMLLRVAVMTVGITHAQSMSGDWDFGLVVITGLAAALYGNLGYLGLVLDRTSRAAAAAQQIQVAEATRREVAERHAETLQHLLAQREQMLELLAHGVRQPLHNASGALQSARLSLDAQPAPLGDASAWAQHRQNTDERLRRAENVLATVQSVLDNTLTAATLLSQREPPLSIDTDLQLLVQLSLGDLPAEQRQRVVCHQLTDWRSAELQPGLVRLALRNLLLNAFTHGGNDVQVRLEVATQAEPPALVLSVVDDGPGASPAVLLGNTANAQPVPSHGLAVVRQVMRLLNGELRLSAESPSGLRASLVLPQPG